MSAEWSSLPLLPLRCILDHLSMEDAIATMSTCRHWRNAVLLYEGRKETLKLKANHLEKNLFLTRLFRKYTRKLHIYIDCNDDELEKFMTYVLPQFFDTVKLHEVVFIGPSYTQHKPNMPAVKLKRIITESLVFKHLQTLQKFALLGCELDTVKNDNDRYTHKQLEYYSRPLSFNDVPSQSDSVLSSCNTAMMVFSSLKHIIVDYEHISTDALETLSHLTMFTHLTMNITNKRQPLTRIDWLQLSSCYPNGLDISLNIIGLPEKKINAVIDNVLVQGLSLTSLKVMFCKTLYTPLISHIVREYKFTLREFVWADCPYESNDMFHRIIPNVSQPTDPTCNINPFMMLCWQCTNLRRLVIHGYWVWQYDLLGFVRLCQSLEHLDISAVYNKHGCFSAGYPHIKGENSYRVMAADTQQTVDQKYIHQINEFTQFKWRPTPWNKLHRGLRARSTPQQRADYALHEARQPLGVT